MQRADCFVISIGNLTTGGTGKTPLACYLAKKLRELDLRVALLSRGYRADSRGINDEALELEFRLPDVPHLQDPNRKKIADIACVELQSEVLILDDGFQHRQLHRDLDLLVIDATLPFGYGYLLPRGQLREPVANLKRADLVVINRCNLVSRQQIADLKMIIREVQPKIKICEADTVPSDLIDHQGNLQPLDSLKNQKAVAFCGIGNPDGFRATLAGLDVNLVDFLEFPDHHSFSREDIASLEAWSQQHPDIELILCTHKDLVKINLERLGKKRLRAVLISNKIRLRERILWQTINEKMQQPPGW